jgi:hypothetical protein
MSSANFVAPVSVITSAAATTTASQKARTSITSSDKSGKISSANTQPSALEPVEQSFASIQASFWFHRNFLLFS